MRANRRLTPYLFLAPAFALFAFAVLGPILATVGFSFTEWPGYGPMAAAGWHNYARALDDEIYLQSFRNIGVYIALTIVLEVGVGLLMAGLVTARRRTGWFRVAFFTPVMLPMVVVAVLWRYVYNADLGLVNGALGALGLDSWKHVWLGESATALIAISVVSGWVYAGFYMTIFYAALSRIPDEIVDAARLDGASERQIFLRVKVPMIRHVVEIALLLCVTGAFQGFDLFYVLTNGGPYNSTEIPTTYLVKVVFRNQEIGYGSALAVLMTLVVALVGLVYMRVRRRGGTALQY